MNSPDAPPANAPLLGFSSAQRSPVNTLAQIQSRMSMDGFGFGQMLGIRVTEIWYGGCLAEIDVRDMLLRPGGTVAGPILMGLADGAMWAAGMTVHEDGVQAVTADMSIHFLRRPDAKVLRCRAEVIKPGRRSMVLRADVMCDDDNTVVTACQGTYAVPSTRIVKD